MSYQGQTNRAILYISEPQFDANQTKAKFYYLSIKSGSCQDDNGHLVCIIDVHSVKRLAEVRDGVILLASSSDSDDSVTHELAMAAAGAINRAIRWCDWWPSGDLFRTPLFRSPF